MKFYYLLIITILIIGCQTKAAKVETKEITTIGILPYDNIEQSVIDSVRHQLITTYGFKVVILDKVKLPKSAYYSPRSRYRADSLLRFETKIIPDSISIIIGLTNKDISTTKRNKKTGKIKMPKHKYTDWGIFGLGQVGGISCVVSTYRLKSKVSRAKFYTRVMRIATHEIGHVLGLFHCPTIDCVMNDANETIKTIDNSTGELCIDCLQKI